MCQAREAALALAPKGVEGVPASPIQEPQLFTMVEKKVIAVRTHLPSLVFNFLVFVALLTGLVAGFGMARGRRNSLSIIVYALVIAVTLGVMVDMEYPREGFIRIGAADLALAELRDSIQ